MNRLTNFFLSLSPEVNAFLGGSIVFCLLAGIVCLHIETVRRLGRGDS